MAIYAANRSLQVSLGIQSQGLLISSLSKKGYNTSGPVRYIPKNYSQFEKPQKPPTLESCEKKEGILFKNITLKGKRGSKKLPKFDDKEHQNSLFHAENTKSSDIFNQDEEFSELEDAKGSSLELLDSDGSESELLLDEVSNSPEDRSAEGNDLLSRSIRQDAEKLAIELLAARSFTEFELRKKLLGKKYPPNIVESVIADMKCRGLLNDGLYAESFSRSRWLSSTWGPRRIKQALIQKGVNVVQAENAMKPVFEGDDFDGDGQHVQHGMSKQTMGRLFLQASKQWLRGQNQNTPLENRKARIVRWLQYRGFNWGVTSFIMKKLEAQYPP